MVAAPNLLDRFKKDSGRSDIKVIRKAAKKEELSTRQKLLNQIDEDKINFTNGKEKGRFYKRLDDGSIKIILRLGTRAIEIFGEGISGISSTEDTCIQDFDTLRKYVEEGLLDLYLEELQKEISDVLKAGRAQTTTKTTTAGKGTKKKS